MYVIIKIVAVVVKDWCGLKYNDTNNLLELYNEFSSGVIDKQAPLSSQIRASVGRSKNELHCDSLSEVADIILFLGPYIKLDSDAVLYYETF